MQNADAHRRYETLLRISAATASQPNVEAVLRTFRVLLSNVVDFESIALLLLDPSHQFVTLRAWERTHHDSESELGTEYALAGTAIAKAIEKQTPVFIPDVRSEIEKFPHIASKLNLETNRSAYVFPISTSRKQLGVLVFGSVNPGPFSREDVELMASVAEHLSVALESALATDAAETYERELAHERDRLRLLLEINNHIVTKLDVKELLYAASTSIRKYFDNDFTSFWLFEVQSNRLTCTALDFPASRGPAREMSVAEVPEEDVDKLRTRTPTVMGAADFAKMPETISAALRSESIMSLAAVPLVTTSGPIGVMTLGSRGENHFGQADLDLLTEISSQIALVLDNAIAYGRLTASRDRLEEERLYLESEIRSEYNFEDIVGKSASLRKVLEQVSIVAPTDSTVLLHGETGTGKELIARAIHNLSQRKNRTFIKLNCAAIPSGLVESELFGHEKGAFTGALMQKRGRLELADHGSLFLDEIGDISLELQPKLLRVLQEQQFERLGSTKTISVDVRIVAATHRDLQAMIRSGDFREDLFYRLNVFPIEIPPLRERRDDIPLLVHYFASKLSKRMRKTIRTIPRPAMDAMVNSPWPGNIRELENFIERAVILTQRDELNVPLRELKNESRVTLPSGSTFEQAERNAIVEGLRAAGGRISGKGGAAERLGLKRTTLQNKMRRLGILRAEYES